MPSCTLKDIDNFNIISSNVIDKLKRTEFNIYFTKNKDKLTITFDKKNEYEIKQILLSVCDKGWFFN